MESQKPTTTCSLIEKRRVPKRSKNARHRFVVLILLLGKTDLSGYPVRQAENWPELSAPNQENVSEHLAEFSPSREKGFCHFTSNVSNMLETHTKDASSSKEPLKGAPIFTDSWRTPVFYCPDVAYIRGGPWDISSQHHHHGTILHRKGSHSLYQWNADHGPLRSWRS